MLYLQRQLRSPRTVYLLDAGHQTFLWETPPTMRYEKPALRLRIARQQAQSTQLLALTSAATRLPLLNISSIVGALARWTRSIRHG